MNVSFPVRLRSWQNWIIPAALALLQISTAATLADIPAFPGAEGPGSNATGGRFGDVYHVTNLLDDANGTIPGSLRYGLKTAPPEGRIIVFDVGGVIQLAAGPGTTTWLRSEAPNITIAGQTAPGPGITIVGAGTKFSGNNWIVRHITIRPGQHQLNPGTYTNDGISVYLQNSIIDHVTVSWYDDEGISATDAVKNTTIQYSIIAEGLNYNSHAYGALISSENDDALISYHHNLFVHNRSRMPRLGSEKGTGAITNWSNNVIYNWTGNAGYSVAAQPSRTNFLANYYIAGPNTSTSNRVFSGGGLDTQIYYAGNMVDMNKNGQIDGVPFNFSGSQFTGTITHAAAPFPVESGYVQSAAEALEQVLNYAGARWWNRDPNDARVIADVRNGTGQFINYVTDVPNLPAFSQYPYPYDSKGLPAYEPVYRPADWDTDQDGMPDFWERAHGLDPYNPDYAGDFDNDGYTNLEEYLNELAAFPAPKPLVFQATVNNRYAVQNNWELRWQPSRFDEAQINSGAVVVDAVGQHAGTLKLAANIGDEAELLVTAGWLQVHKRLLVGAAGNGRLLQTGGQVLVTEAVILGSATGQGEYELSGGLLNSPALLQDGQGGRFIFTGGILQVGLIGFDLTVSGGTLAPGNSVGQTTVLGSLRIESGALEIELAGDQEADRLVVTGLLTLGGELRVRLSDGYQPAPDQRWLIITADAIEGDFQTVTPGFVIDRQPQAIYLVAVPETTTLTLTAGLAGSLLRRRRGN